MQFSVDNVQLIRYNSRDRGRLDEHKQVLVAGCIKEIIGLENVGWFRTGASWVGAISLGQGISLAISGPGL